MSHLYDKIKEDFPGRKKWAEKCGYALNWSHLYRMDREMT